MSSEVSPDRIVQETSDGELVVLHDLHSVLAASHGHDINRSIMQELAGQGLQLETPATSAKVRRGMIGTITS